MFVLNDVRHDARVLREAGSLRAAGHVVTIVGRPSHGHRGGAQREVHDGVEILRVPVPGRVRAFLLLAGAGRGSAPEGGTGTGARSPGGRLRPLGRAWRAALRVPLVGRLLDGFDWLVRWRFGTLAWCRVAAAASPVADVWFGHDLSAIPAALAARQRHGGRAVYDMHELYLDAGDTATRPRWARAIVARSERAAIRDVDAVMTVNSALAAAIREVAAPKRLVVVHNAALRRQAGDEVGAGSPLRAALGLDADVPLAIYTGSLAPGRGVETIVAASREPSLAGVHVAFLGDGVLRPWLEAAAAAASSGGRLHVLPAVEPLTVTDWVAGADVAVLPIAPTTRNHRLSTPNKLFEAIAAGVPVVASDFAAMREIVLGDPAGPLGVVCDPTSPWAVAEAIATIVAAPAAERNALRARVRHVAFERWSWEREGAKVVDLVADLSPAVASMAADVAATAPEPQRLVIVLPSSGQFDSRTRRIAVGCAARGHMVTVVARREAGLPDVEELAPRARLIRIDAGYAPASPDAPPRGAARRAISEARRILGVARRTSVQARAAVALGDAAILDANVVHAMGFLALPVGRALAGGGGATLVYDARDIYAQSTNLSRLPGSVRWLFLLRERRWARGAARVVTTNESFADYLATSLGVRRPLVVMNCQPAQAPRRRRPNRLRKALGLATGTPIVLYHGGFMTNRGLPELVTAFGDTRLQRAHLVLMGYGGLDERLQAAIASSPSRDRIHVLGAVPPDELLEWVGSADVGVMPNQPRNLNERLSTPNKLFECLAAGTPVVSSDFHERRRIVVDDPDGPLGAVCDPTDPAAIAAAIASILDLPKAGAADLRTRCARAARARYSWEPQFERLVAEYSRLTGRAW